jgi:hypothetical protein
LLDCNHLLVKWDNKGLYFAYWLRDKKDNATTVNKFWAGDSFEMFIDPINRKPTSREKSRNYQYWIWPRHKGRKGAIGYCPFTKPRANTSVLLSNGSIKFKSIRKKGIYTCEVFLPARLLKGLYLYPGQTIGFNYSINNGQNTYIRWVTNVGKNISSNPHFWGDLLLMGTIGQITINNEFVLPGQTVTCVVQDHDMNIHPHRKDKIWVKAFSNLTQDQLDVALEEVGPDSGIFYGGFLTDFGFSASSKQALMVRPGDVIVVRYLDLHSFGGEENVPRYYTVPVGKAVYSVN